MSWVRCGVPWIVLATLLAGAAGALAAEEDRVKILADTGPDGRTTAGTVNTLGWVLLTEDGEPAFHQDAVFEVTFEDRTLLRTTPGSGHDYDGIDPYQVAFPGPGTYTVSARVFDDGTERTASMTGQVLPAPEASARLQVDGPQGVRTGEPAAISYEVLGPDGEGIEHADVTVSIRRASDGFEVFRTTTHDHDGTHQLSYVLDRPGTFQLVLVATPVAGEGTPTWGPTAKTLTFEVTEGPPSTDIPQKAPAERPLLNAREQGTDDETYQLFGTYDPYTSVGPHGRLRLGAIALDAETGQPARNVSYQAVMHGPDGTQLFQSSSLTAVDGFLEVTTNRPTVGSYMMRVGATKGDWSDHVTLNFTVQPPVAAVNNGALFASPNATGPLEAGLPSQLPIQVDDAAGVPLMHGEVDWRLVDPDTGVPWATGKLHTHENGTFPLTVNVAQQGQALLEVMPQSLQPTPTPYTYGEEIGQAPFFTLDVAEGPGLPGGAAEQLDPTGSDEANGTPGPGIAWVAALLAGSAAALVRRR